MKRLLLLSLIASSALFAANSDDRNFDGYSYFAMGVENFRYTEKFIYTFNSTYVSPSGKTYLKGQQVAVKSKVNVNSPVYLSGGVIRFNPKWDLSMDFASTLKPNQTTEDWLDRGDDSVITTNYATIMSNSMKFLLHYKLTNQHRLTFGFSYILNTFKRYNEPNSGTTQLVEETSSTATLDVGYWFESNTAAKNGFRIKYEITAGLPVYQDLKNTAAPGLSFNNTSGFNLDTSLYIGYTLLNGLEMGVFGNYSYMYRDGETKQYNGQTVIWPTNITQSLRGGLQVTWKFN
ncbi:hypothetical protein [Nautilia sp.]